MPGGVVAGLRKMHVACVWELSVRHGAGMVEPAPARMKHSLASMPGQGHLLPGQRQGSRPARAGKSTVPPELPG